MRKKHNRRYPKLDLVFPDSPDLVVGTAGAGMTYSPLVRVKFPELVQTPSQQREYIEMLQRQGHIFIFDRRKS